MNIAEISYTEICKLYNELKPIRERDHLYYTMIKKQHSDRLINDAEYIDEAKRISKFYYSCAVSRCMDKADPQ